MSDEVDCHQTEQINLQVYPEKQIIRQGQEAVFRCKDESGNRKAVSWIREGNRPLPLGSLDRRGRLLLANAQTNYTGLYVCVVLDPSQSSYLAQKAVHLKVQPSKLP